jgi:hypothetical protein
MDCIRPCRAEIILLLREKAEKDVHVARMEAIATKKARRTKESIDRRDVYLSIEEIDTALNREIH